MPRSATTQTRLIEKRLRNWSTAGIRLPTSAVFPGHISVHAGRPSPSSSTARIIWLRSGRWSWRSPPSERLPARALEIETGGVHEHQVDRAEAVAPPREQLLLHDVLQATRRKGRCAGLLAFGEFFAEPAHGAIEVMQAEALDALDPVILPPAVGGAIRAARKQAVQNGKENRALQRKIILARTGEARDDCPAAGLLRQALERQGGPIRRAGLVVASPSATAPTTTMALSAKRAPERNSRSNCPLWRRSSGDRAWR